jgi:hypothetical protein
MMELLAIAHHADRRPTRLPVRARPAHRRSQRELVTESLIRCPDPSKTRGAA